MLLLLAGLCSVLMALTSSRTFYDPEARENHAFELPKISITDTIAEGEELQDFVGNMNQSDSSDHLLLKERDVHSEDSSVQIVSKDNHSGISKRSVTVTGAPNLCENMPIDTFLMTKDESTYVFKGEFYWKIKGNNGFHSGYPKIITEDWDGLPGYIEASFTWPRGATYFFKGKWYWRFVDMYMDPGYPKLIREGFPGIPDYIDAAVALRDDDKAYFFKGHQYWRYKSSEGYPKNIKNDWDGLPSYLDAAFRWDNNRSYFFKDDLYYRIIDSSFKVDPIVMSKGARYPLPISEEWFGC